MRGLTTEAQLVRALAEDPLYSSSERAQIYLEKLLRTRGRSLEEENHQPLKAVCKIIFEETDKDFEFNGEIFIDSNTIALFFITNDFPIPKLANCPTGISTDKIVNSNELEYGYYFEKACAGEKPDKYEDLEGGPLDKLILRTYVSLKQDCKGEPKGQMVLDNLHKHDHEGILEKCSIHQVRQRLTEIRKAESPHQD